MRIVFAPTAWEDNLHWQGVDPRVVKRIHELIKDTTRNPFAGLGKPEPLRFALAGFWSRRITQEHRVVFRTKNGSLLIAQLRYLY
jgi:toxin YoeB